MKELLGLDDEKARRVTFNEITKKVVTESIQHPRDIDLSLVDAQQARRVLDRIVGYEISPLLWKKVRRGLSAGRVQSVATRMVCDREDEIRAFQSEEYWLLDAFLKRTPEETPFRAEVRSRSDGCGAGGQCESVFCHFCQKDTEAVLSGASFYHFHAAAGGLSPPEHDAAEDHVGCPAAL